MTAAITTTEIFLIAMGIIFTVPYLIWRVLRTDYYAPLVVVQNVAGILLGPGILGRHAPGLLRLRVPPGSDRVHRRYRARPEEDVASPGGSRSRRRRSRSVRRWDMGGSAVLLAAAVLLLAAVSGKLMGTTIAGRILGWARGEAAIIGWLLQTKALIMIIFVNVLLDKGLISSETFTALLLMAVVSTMLTVPMVAGRLRRARELIVRAA